MTNKTFHIPEKQISNLTLYLGLAQKHFERDGNKWTLGRTLFKIVEEWSQVKGFINTTNEMKNAKTLEEFYSQPEYIKLIRTYIKNAKKGSQGALKSLWEICLEIDSNFKIVDNSFPNSLYDILDFLKSKIQINGE